MLLGELFLYSSFQICCYKDNKLHVTTAGKCCTSSRFTNSNLTPRFSKFKQMRLPLSWASCSTTLLASIFLFSPIPISVFSIKNLVCLLSKKLLLITSWKRCSKYFSMNKSYLFASLYRISFLVLQIMIFPWIISEASPIFFNTF